MALINGQEILYFMSVGAALPDQSFEELRIQDYLGAYKATGRPPAPCPQSPDTPTARAALGLPPLFVPTAIPAPPDSLGGPSGGGSTSSTSSSAPMATVTLLTDLPAHHEFQPFKNIATSETFECISAQPLYALFSHEELRYHAYTSGNKMPPPIPSAGTMMEGPSSGSVTTPVPPHKFYVNDTPATAYLSSPTAPGISDHLMSIVASPKFEKHSFEELRIAYLLAGKEVGSSEIPMRGALPAQPAPTLFGRPRGDAFSSGSSRNF